MNLGWFFESSTSDNQFSIRRLRSLFSRIIRSSISRCKASRFSLITSNLSNNALASSLSPALNSSVAGLESGLESASMCPGSLEPELSASSSLDPPRYIWISYDLISNRIHNILEHFDVKYMYPSLDSIWIKFLIFVFFQLKPSNSQQFHTLYPIAFGILLKKIYRIQHIIT